MTTETSKTAVTGLDLLTSNQMYDLEYLSGLKNPAVVVPIGQKMGRDEKLALLATAVALCEKIGPSANIICVADRGEDLGNISSIIQTLSLNKKASVISADQVRAYSTYAGEKKCTANLGVCIEHSLGEGSYLPYTDHIALMRTLARTHGAEIVLEAREDRSERSVALGRSGCGAPRTLCVDHSDSSKVASVLKAQFLGAVNGNKTVTDTIDLDRTGTSCKTYALTA